MQKYGWTSRWIGRRAEAEQEQSPLPNLSPRSGTRSKAKSTTPHKPKEGLYGPPAQHGAPVIFQEVVHSIRTGEADCDEQSSFPGKTEWTSTRMPDLPFAVESNWRSLYSPAMTFQRRRTALSGHSQDRRQVGPPFPRPGPRGAHATAPRDRIRSPRAAPRRNWSTASSSCAGNIVPAIRSPALPGSVPPPSAASCAASVSAAGAICIPLHRSALRTSLPRRSAAPRYQGPYPLSGGFNARRRPPPRPA